MKINKGLLIGVFVFLVSVFSALAYWYTDREAKEKDSMAKAHAELLVRSYSPTLGAESAPVTIVEFLDPECEACRALYPMVKQMLQEFGGKVRLVVRYMPLHGNSAYAAKVLESARKQGRYWEALEMLFARQPEWGSHHAPRPELILPYMKDLGLDMERLNASLNDMEITSKIRQDQEDGQKLGVMRTPTFFVNGKVLNELSPQGLRSAINGNLKQ